MKIGAMNNPQRNIYEEIKKIKRCGFNFIDLTYEPPEHHAYDPKKIKDLLAINHLEIVGHTNPGLPAIYPVEEIRQASINELKKTVDFFSLLNVKKMTIHPFYLSGHSPIEERINRNIEVFWEINEYCKKSNIQLMVENYLYPFNSVEIFKRIFSEISDLFFHVDLAHCNIGHDGANLIEELFSFFAKKITHLHMHDNRGMTDEHLPIGCGTIDWKTVIQTLKKYNYDSTITLEIFCTDEDYLKMSRKKLLEFWNEKSV